MGIVIRHSPGGREGPHMFHPFLRLHQDKDQCDVASKQLTHGVPSTHGSRNQDEGLS